MITPSARLPVSTGPAELLIPVPASRMPDRTTEHTSVPESQSRTEQVVESEVSPADYAGLTAQEQSRLAAAVSKGLRPTRYALSLIKNMTITGPQATHTPEPIETRGREESDILRDVASRLRDEPIEPPDMAELRTRLTRRAAHALGEQICRRSLEVDDVLPKGTPFLSRLGGLLLDPQNTDAAIAHNARRLGVGASPHVMRERLLGMVYVAQKMPQFGDFVRPNVPYLTEGLTVGSLLNEFRLVKGVSLDVLATESGVELRTIHNLFMHGIRPGIGTTRAVMDALDLPSGTMEPMLGLYEWEIRMRIRARYDKAY